MARKPVASVEIHWPNDQEILAGVATFIDQNAGAIAEDIAAEAEATTAFKDKTGKLRKSIRARKMHSWTGSRGGTHLTESVPTNRDVDGVVWVVQASDPKAHLIELGHVKKTRKGKILGTVPAYPFIRPALEKIFAKASALFAQGRGYE